MSVNFSNNVPAAPANAVNVTWAYDGSANASASVPLMSGDSGSGGSAGLVPAPPTGSSPDCYLRADGTWVQPTAAPMAGDNGSGGAAGIVPAPAAGDAAAGMYLRADATWEVPRSMRATATITTASLAANAVATGSITLAKTAAIMQITSSANIALSLYARQVDLTNGTNAIISSLPVSATTGELFVPAILAFNFDSAASTNIYYSATNQTSTTQAVTVTFTYLPLE